MLCKKSFYTLINIFREQDITIRHYMGIKMVILLSMSMKHGGNCYLKHRYQYVCHLKRRRQYICSLKSS